MKFFDNGAESIEDDLLGKLIDWHNETDTVVRVDIYDPFIIEILQNQKLWKLIEKSIEENERYKNDPDSGGLYYELQNLLEESKK